MATSGAEALGSDLEQSSYITAPGRVFLQKASGCPLAGRSSVLSSVSGSDDVGGDGRCVTLLPDMLFFLPLFAFPLSCVSSALMLR